MSVRSVTSCQSQFKTKDSAAHAVAVVPIVPSPSPGNTSDDLGFLHDLIRELSAANNGRDGSKEDAGSKMEISQLYGRVMTLIRRSLRHPLLRRNEDEFPPNAVALCAVAHLFQTSISKVYSCHEKLLQDISRGSPALEKERILKFDVVQKVYHRAWLRLVDVQKGREQSSSTSHARSPSISNTVQQIPLSSHAKSKGYGKNDGQNGSLDIDTKALPVHEKTSITALNAVSHTKPALRTETNTTPGTRSTPVTPRTLHASGEKVGPEDSGTFERMHIILVTNPRMTPRTATSLKSGIEAQCGRAELVPASEASPKKLTSLTQSAYPRFTTVVSDAAFITRHLKLCDKDDTEFRRTEKTPEKQNTRNYDILSHKWLSDSIRAKRIKSREVYTNTPPPKRLSSKSPHLVNPAIKVESRRQTTETSSSTPMRSRQVTDLRAEANLSDGESPSPCKRARPNEGTASVAVRLFETPSSVEARSNCKWWSDEMPEPEEKKRLDMGPRWACEVRVGKSRANFGEFPSNEKICEQLEIVLSSYEARRDKFRILGYSKAIARIKALDFDVENVDDVMKLRKELNIGERIADKVEEIVKTGELRQAQEVLKNADFNALQDLCAVWGVGPVKALSLLTRGIRNIRDLRKAASMEPSLLDRCQTIGMRRYEDLCERLPRSYVAELEMYVRKVVKGIDELLNITIAGSYIRGKKWCGDVDILIHGEGRRVRSAFEKVKQAMRKSGVLTDDLVDGSGKYFGVFRLPGRKHGRIDLFAVPIEEYPYALLTYTGSAVFNRSMRAKARALGYTLSHHGLQRVNRNAAGKTRVEPSVMVQHEQDIFRLLDIPYVPPCERSIS